MQNNGVYGVMVQLGRGSGNRVGHARFAEAESLPQEYPKDIFPIPKDPAVPLAPRHLCDCPYLVYPGNRQTHTIGHSWRDELANGAQIRQGTPRSARVDHRVVARHSSLNRHMASLSPLKVIRQLEDAPSLEE